MNWKRHVLFIAFLAMLCTATALAAPALDTVVPENVSVFLAIRSVPQLKAKLQDSEMNALWQEPSVQAFLEAPKARLEEMLAEQEGKVGFKFPDVLALFEGQIAFTYWSDADLKDGGMIVMAEVGPQGERALQIVRAIADSIAKEAEVAPLTYVEETYNGAKLIMVQPAARADAAAEPFDPEDAFYFGLSGDVLLLGGPKAALARAVDALAAPPAAALAGNASYQAVLLKINPESDLIAYASAPRIIEQIRSGAATASQFGENPARVLQQFNSGVVALGFDSLDAAGYGVLIDGEFATGTLFARVNGQPRGIVKILMPEPGPLETGESVPEDVASFASARVSLAPVWDEVQRIVAGFSPNAMAAVNGYLDQLAQKLGQPFNLRNDVLSVFGPRMSTYTWYEKPFNMMTSKNTIFRMDISSAAAFDNAWQKLQALFPEFLSMFKQKDYMGYRVFSMEMPGMAGGMSYTPMQAMGPGPGMMPTPALAVTDTEVIISSKLDTVQAHLRRLGGQGPSLAALSDFQDAIRSLPSENRILIGYGDGRKVAEYGLTLLKEGQLDSIIQMMGAGIDNPQVAELFNLFDFTKTPPPEDVIKHLNPSGTVGTVGPEGLMLISRSRIRSQAR